MRGLALFLFLAGCAAPVVEERPIEVEIVDQTPTGITVKMKTPPTPPKPTDKPHDKAHEKPAAPVVKLPPCQSVPGDKRTAALQKLDCLIETGNIPIPVKPKP